MIVRKYIHMLWATPVSQPCRPAMSFHWEMAKWPGCKSGPVSQGFCLMPSQIIYSCSPYAIAAWVPCERLASATIGVACADATRTAADTARAASPRWGVRYTVSRFGGDRMCANSWSASLSPTYWWLLLLHLPTKSWFCTPHTSTAVVFFFGWTHGLGPSHWEPFAGLVPYALTNAP